MKTINHSLNYLPDEMLYELAGGQIGSFNGLNIGLLANSFLLASLAQISLFSQFLALTRSLLTAGGVGRSTGFNNSGLVGVFGGGRGTFPFLGSGTSFLGQFNPNLRPFNSGSFVVQRGFLLG